MGKFEDDFIDLVIAVRKRTLEEIKQSFENADIDPAEPLVEEQYRIGWNESLSMVLERLSDRIRECK